MAVSTGRLALLDAAEKLVALKGIHGTSARELTKAAGQRNNSAITYHFGSWHGLLDAVWTRHAPRINIERATLVEVAERDAPPALPHPRRRTVVARRRRLGRRPASTRSRTGSATATAAPIPQRSRSRSERTRPRP